jgi:3',5'-cyclic AMP phosphodiesterase CpdA
VSGTVSWRKRLTDGVAFRSVLARHGAELVLHGHAHRNSLTHLETPAGRTLALGVPSASSLGRKPNRRARYHLYRLARNSADWEVVFSVRGYSPVEESFTEESEDHLLLPHRQS